MPASMINSGGTENKVRVTKLYGDGSAVIGVMDPRPNMRTLGLSGSKFINEVGRILSVQSGNYTCRVGMGSGDTPVTFYPYQLFVSLDEASGNFSWPTGDGSLVFGHNHGLTSAGNPYSPQASGNMMNYIDSAGIQNWVSRSIIE